MTIPKGWQPISAAVKSLGVTRQRIHQLIESKDIPVRWVFGKPWVPCPLDYKPDRARQLRAKHSKKVLDNR